MNLKQIIEEELKKFEESPVMKRLLGAEDMLIASGRLGDWTGDTISTTLSTSLTRVALAMRDVMVVEIRGSEKEVEATKCGLYHWNAARTQAILQAEEFLNRK